MREKEWLKENKRFPDAVLASRLKRSVAAVKTMKSMLCDDALVRGYENNTRTTRTKVVSPNANKSHI